ncbi:hypothetical protein B0T11DRAFT_291115 [Plectosphaerella cucumerina]|uniref:Uncharacterized protein n=1 Tax=Plectosphaerella cucumerina TaxID=40658 RepID=A0A8K0WZH9_9PEZI|nr:hypothetical protein B0T11DRAFT_291115 [Plectosphaerella cucumerina]
MAGDSQDSADVEQPQDAARKSLEPQTNWVNRTFRRIFKREVPQTNRSHIPPSSSRNSHEESDLSGQSTQWRQPPSTDEATETTETQLDQASQSPKHDSSTTVHHETHVKPAVVEEHIRPHHHVEYQVQRTRSIHIHEHRTIIQPIIQKESSHT